MAHHVTGSPFRSILHAICLPLQSTCIGKAPHQEAPKAGSPTVSQRSPSEVLLSVLPLIRHLALGSPHGMRLVARMCQKIESGVKEHNPVKVSRRICSPSEVLSPVMTLILRFIPGAALDMREVSRTFRDYTNAFLCLYTKEIVSDSSHAYPLLSILIRRIFDNLSVRPGAQPYRIAMRCQLQIPRLIRGLGVSGEECPDGILSVREIGEFESRIKEHNMVQVWGRIRSPGEVLPSVLARVLHFIPGCALDMRLVSSTFRHHTNAFLCQYMEEVLSDSFHAYPLLSVSIHRHFDSVSRHCPKAKPHLIAIKCQLEIPWLIREYGVPKAKCPDGILSVREIGEFESRIKEDSLVKVWGCIRQGLPAAPGVPAADASVQVIRTWMGEDANRIQLAKITWINLSISNIRWLPEGIFQTMPALTRISLSGNFLKCLPEGLFQGLSALRVIDLSSNCLPSLPAGIFQGLPALKVVCMAKNVLDSLPAGIFQGLHLQRLRLDNRTFSSLPEGSLQGVADKIEIDLGDMQLKIIEG